MKLKKKNCIVSKYYWKAYTDKQIRWKRWRSNKMVMVDGQGYNCSYTLWRTHVGSVGWGVEPCWGFSVLVSEPSLKQSDWWLVVDTHTTIKGVMWILDFFFFLFLAKLHSLFFLYSFLKISFTLVFNSRFLFPNLKKKLLFGFFNLNRNKYKVEGFV